MLRSHEARLRRVEAWCSTALPQRAFVLRAHTVVKADRRLAETFADGTQQPGWPVIILTGLPAAGAPRP